MTARSLYAAALFGAAVLSGCEKAKPAADTTAAANAANAAGAAAAIPAPDTMKASPASVADSTKMKQQASMQGAATKGTPATIPPKVPAKAKTKTKILGRDSVDTKPKLIGLPVVRDTLKPKKP